MFKCIENQFSRLIVLIFVGCFCIVVVNLLPIGEVVETIDRVQIFFASHCLVFFFFLSLSEDEDVKNYFSELCLSPANKKEGENANQRQYNQQRSGDNQGHRLAGLFWEYI